MGNFLSWLLIFGVVQILLLLFIFVGIPLLLIRFLLGRGRSEGGGVGGGSTGEKPRASGAAQWGWPTGMYTGNSKLSNFKVDPKVYNFGTPKITPNLEKLRNPADIDMDKARELFLGGGLAGVQPKEVRRPTLNLNKARELFLPGEVIKPDYVYPEDEEDEPSSPSDSSFS